MSTSTFEFEAIGTRWVIDIDQDVSNAQLRELQRAVRTRIDEFDKVYSRFRDDSLVTKISQQAGTYEFPDDAEKLFDFYRQLYDVTGGKVTPLIGNLISDAGYDAKYSLQPKSQLHPAPDWDSVMSFEFPKLKTETPVLLDFGAAGKGYLIDIVGEVLQGLGITSFCVDGSGDFLRRSDAGDALRVGLEHPTNPELAIGVAQLGSGSICGSSGNRRKWGNLHHIMDPHTTKPVTDIIASWTMAETALIADGMATALFFSDPQPLRDVWEFEYCFVRSDFSMKKSPDLEAEIFTRDSNEPH